MSVLPTTTHLQVLSHTKSGETLATYPQISQTVHNYTTSSAPTLRNYATRLVALVGVQHLHPVTDVQRLLLLVDKVNYHL